MALDFAAGCLGGCAGVVVGYPFDTIKVHLQTQDHRNPLYKGTLDCFRKIIAKESVRGLYRGMSSPMAGVAAVNAIVFGVYGNVQRNNSDPDSLYSHFLAGTAAGLAQSFICSPMELVKTRLQLQDNLPKGALKFSGPMQCTRSIWRNEGFRGVFRGLGITAALTKKLRRRRAFVPVPRSGLNSAASLSDERGMLPGSVLRDEVF